MHSLTVSQQVSHPVDKVWKLLDKFSETSVYHPFVEESFSVNGKEQGLGARRQCTMYDGKAVQEEITAYDPENLRYKVEIVEAGPFPFKVMQVWIDVKPDNENTLITYSAQFVPKFGALGWLMAKVIMKPQFRKMFSRLIDGIDMYLMTNRVVQKGGG